RISRRSSMPLRSGFAWQTVPAWRSYTLTSSQARRALRRSPFNIGEQKRKHQQQSLLRRKRHHEIIRCDIRLSQVSIVCHQIEYYTDYANLQKNWVIEDMRALETPVSSFLSTANSLAYGMLALFGLVHRC